jgi:ATP/maltotriose-dependent transcriptional regulator MalT
VQAEHRGTITPVVSRALEHIIERPRLLARLGEDGGARITVLEAPAGYGKTTLARQWSERHFGPVVWYRTTRASGDVALLAVQLDELLASIAPTIGPEPLEVASIAAVNPSPEPLARAIVRKFGSLADGVLLVVDEWEAAGTEEADELLSMLVQELRIRFLITTRTRPAWFTARLEMYGEGLEIGVDELAMTDDEAAKVLATSEAVAGRARLTRTAAGWPAVLGLAAMSGEVDLTSSRFLSRTLYEFLATELLAGAARETQDALMLLAVASVRDLEVARTVLDSTADRVIADALARGLVAVTDSKSLSLHPLMREVLNRRFEEADAETRNALLAQSRRLFEPRRWDEALSVAEVARDAAFVTDGIEASVDDLLAAGRTSSLQRWVVAAHDAGAKGGLIDYAESQVLMRGFELDRAMALATQAADSLTGDLSARAHIVAARAAHLTDRIELAEQHADSAAALAQSPATREEALILRCIPGQDSERPDVRDRVQQYERSSRPSPARSIRLAGFALMLAELEGGIEPAIDNARCALPLATEGIDPFAHTSFLNVYTWALILTCRYDEGLVQSGELTRIAESWGLEFAVSYAQLYRARALTGMRKFGAADRTLAMLERRVPNQQGTFFLSSVPVERAGLYLSVGEVQRALDVVSLGPLEQLSRTGKGELLGWQALVHAVAGRSGQALTLAEDARLTSRRRETRVLSLLADAIVAVNRADTATAASRIEAVIDSRLLHPAVVAIRAAPALGAFIADEDGPWRNWLQRVLAASSDTALARKLGLRVPGTAPRAADLTPRESEVHELLAQGLTNEQIANQLYISVSTTKVHVKHIYAKLGVRSRPEAARALREDF